MIAHRKGLALKVRDLIFYANKVVFSHLIVPVDIFFILLIALEKNLVLFGIVHSGFFDFLQIP